MKSNGQGWLPVDGLPVGLVTWHARGGPVAILAAWLAIIDGQPPELRAGCSGRGAGRIALPVDADFAVNVPAEPVPPEVRRLLARAAAGRPVALRDPAHLAPARCVNAPLLAGCALQLECAHGWLVPGSPEPALAGEVLLLHRGGLLLAPAAYRDFCALQPLRVRVPS